MEELKSSAIAVCTVSAAVCIVGGIISGTRLKKSMKLLLDMILTIVIITPFLNGKIDFDIPDIGNFVPSEYSESSELYNNELIRQTSYNISEVLLQQLQSAGINCKKIETEVNISEDGSIYISKVTLNADDFKTAEEIVRSSLGAETEVINEAE